MATALIERLEQEIAHRRRSVEGLWLGDFWPLPDPDPVLRKLGQALPVYRELLSDAHVFSCVQSRKGGILSAEWEIAPAAGGEAGRNKKAADLVTEFMAEFDVYQAIADILEAPLFGMAPIEVLWQAGLTWRPKALVGRPPEWFVFDTENRLRFLSKDNMTQGELLPEMKFLLPRHHASYPNPYGERILSRCFWPVAFKKAGFKFWAILAEKYGIPWAVARCPRGPMKPSAKGYCPRCKA